MKVKEIRVVTHTPGGIPAVVLLFDNGTSSACKREFKDYTEAKAFADGMQAAFDWQKIIAQPPAQ